MSTLMRPDLNQARPDVHSFLGQALAQGRRFEQLPESVADTLMAFLRARGLGYAQRYRSGIAIGREGLEQGVTQALTCVDLGLEKAADGDLNRAVELLARGDFEFLRQQGWELAFARLDEMQRTCNELLAQEEVAFLRDAGPQIERWARVVPETWISANVEGEAEPVDPREEYPVFAELREQLAFLRSLPRGALDALRAAAPEGGTFDQVLRHLVLALALDRTELVPQPSDAARFQVCFAEGQMLPEVQQKVLRLLDDHLEKSLADPDARARLRSRAEDEIARLGEMGAEAAAELFAAARRGSGV